MTLLLKTNLDLRLVVDYSELNKFLIDEVIELSRINEQSIKLRKVNFFTQLDLSYGFNRITIDKESEKYTGFAINGLSYWYNRILFGLTSRPKISQKMLNSILARNVGDSIYIDDVIIFDGIRDIHSSRVNEVLKRLYSFNAKIYFEISKFGLEEIKVLG